MKKGIWPEENGRPARKPLHLLILFYALAGVATVLLLSARASGSDFNRWIPLQGAYNFRDVGGYDAGTTQTVATGLVYRSDALQNITSTDTAVIQSLGIGLIIDLRTAGEVSLYPDSALLDAFTTHTYVPISFDYSSTNSVEIYSRTFLARHDEWRQVFETIADPANLPLNYHCQAGKDRTGMMTAQLLTLLGVDRETVVEDYMLSVSAGYYVEQSWIERILDDIETSGGINLYLDTIGIDESERRAIRENLLVPRPTAVRSWQHY